MLNKSEILQAQIEQVLADKEDADNFEKEKRENNKDLYENIDESMVPKKEENFTIDPIEFMEATYNIIDSKGLLKPLRLTESQKIWMKKGPLYNDPNNCPDRISLKCRGAGFSLVNIAVEAVTIAIMYARSYQPLVAGTSVQAKRLISKCNDLIRFANIEIPLNERVLSKETKTFQNGSIIESFAGGNPDSIHGPRAIAGYCDEFAHAPYQREIVRAIRPMFTEGGCLSYISTPKGKNNVYWDYIDRAEDMGLYVHKIILVKDVSKIDFNRKSFYEQVKEGIVEMNPNVAWISPKQMDKDWKDDLDEFKQNYLGDPVDEITSVFPEDLLSRVFIQEPHNPENYELVKARTNYMHVQKFYGGIDFAAVKDETAFIVGEVKYIPETNRKELFLRRIITTRGEYNLQKSYLDGGIADFSPHFSTILCDETSLGGINWVSDLKSTSGSIIRGITYNKTDFVEEGMNINNKNFMVQIAKRMMQQGFVHIPKTVEESDRLYVQLRNFEKIVRENYVAFSGKKGGKERDDIAMALMQMILAFYIGEIRNDEFVDDSDEDVESEFGTYSW